MWYIQADFLFLQPTVNFQIEWTHLCNECGKWFGTENQLKRHTARFHSTITLACPYCDKQFKTRLDMRKHMIYHSNIKPHKCSMCNYESHKRGNVGVHLKSNHGVIVENPTKAKDIVTNALKLQECNQWVNDQMGDIVPLPVACNANTQRPK